MTTPQRAHVADAGTLVDVGGHAVVLTYSSLGAEYEALRTRAVVVDRSQRARMRMTGERAAEMLTGLVTNDVLALEPGHGHYAAALTPKGKIVADVRVFRDDAGLLIDTSPRAAEGWAGLVRKFVNPRLAAYRDESATLRDVGVFGPNARHVVAAITGARDRKSVV
jgi:glycine cleavage system aminomethyltransferase T